MANNITYKTPYGTWTLIDQAMAYIFNPQKIEIQSLNAYIKSTTAIGGKLTKKGCIWSIPPEGWKSLAEYSAPVDEQAVKSIGLVILTDLRKLHDKSLSMGDFSPYLVYVSTDFTNALLYPTPWLESQVKTAPGETPNMSFVAPDLERPVGQADSLLSDVYSFGCLLWFLLTGMDRKSNPMLPSEFDSSLAQWDAIIDGCTRNNPARRFKTFEQIQNALSQIKTQTSPLSGEISPLANSTVAIESALVDSRSQVNALQVQNTAAPAVSTAQSHERILNDIKLSRRSLLIGGASIVGAGLLYSAIKGLNLSVPGINTPYRRGFASTVLSYQNRNYEGAKWVKKHKLPTESDSPLVSGWDDNNYWIYSYGSIYKYSNGSYVSMINDVNECVTLFPVSKDLVYALTRNGGHFWCRYTLFAIDNNGAERVIFNDIERPREDNSMYQVNNGIIRIHDHEEGRVLCFDANSHKESYITPSSESFFIHDIDNNIEKNSIASIRDVHSITSGLAYGIRDDSLIKYYNNIWQTVQEFPFKMNRFYLDMHGNTVNGIIGLGSSRGQVYRISSKGNHEIQINNTSSESTLDLKQVWGVDINRFWVMDDSGSIWQWENNSWRHVVRGILDSSHGITAYFKDSWISPTGTAYGITKEYLYQLEWN